MRACEAAYIARNPWYWVANYALTADEHWVGKHLPSPYQRFPPKEYLRSATYLLWAYDYTAWPKSRQMMLTWLVCAYMLGQAMQTPGQLYMIQSKKAVDAVAVLERQEGIWNRVRQIAPWFGADLTASSFAPNGGYLSFANGTQIVACPQGGHQVQSYTPTWLWADEAQLQDEMEEAYHQALPCAERITLVGSADFGWFWQVFLADKLGEERE